METVELEDHSRRSANGTGPRPVRLHLSRPPVSLAGAPVLVLSHGTGGSAAELDWLAGPLVEAGFTVAAPDHHGNNYIDGYAAAGFACLWDRPLDLSFILDYLAAREDIGAVGAAGFSFGGYASAAVLGARIDRRRYAALRTYSADGVRRSHPGDDVRVTLAARDHSRVIP